jgi:hypothetical protein
MGLSDASVDVKNQEQQGGKLWVVGGQLDIDTDAGGKLTINGSDVTSSVATGGIAGVAAGYKLARGSTALGGSNPTTVVTGLATVVAFVCSIDLAVAPGDSTSVLTSHNNATPGSVDVYAWKNTGGTDPTLVASTGTETFNWIAIGT